MCSAGVRMVTVFGRKLVAKHWSSDAVKMHNNIRRLIDSSVVNA